MFKEWRTLKTELMGWRIATFKVKESHNHLHNQTIFILNDFSD